MIRRRECLFAATAGLMLRATGLDAAPAANQWFELRGDDGQPVPNGRAPIELVEDIEDLPGAIWAGPMSAAIKLVEFYDYNCPWCRAADAQRTVLRRDNPDLRVALVNNPILSQASVQAAKIDLAVLRLRGAAASYGLHQTLFATPGRIDGARAVDAVVALGADRAAVEAAAASPEIAEMLARQMRLAASLGIAATPSYVIAGAVVLGYPGPATLGRIVANARTCGVIAC